MQQLHLSAQQRDVCLALLVVLAMVLAPFGFAPHHASAANTNYYVNSVSGNDGNAGTSSGSPWKSLGPVNSRTFGAGDVINLARGSSWTGSGGNSAALTINGSGASGSPITVQPYGSGAAPILRNPSSGYAQAVLVRGSWVVVQGLLLRDSMETGIKLLAGADHVVVQNNEVTASGAGVQIESQYNLVTHNNFHDLSMVVNTPGGNEDYGATGVVMKGPNNEVSYNRFTNCNAPSYDFGEDGSAVESFGNVDNSTIHHNFANNANAFNEIGGGSARNVKISYNLIINSSTVEVIHASDGFASVVANVQFTNNTMVATGNPYNAFWVGGSLPNASALVMRNNVFYGGFQVIYSSSSPFTHDHNLFNLTGGGQLNFSLGTGDKQADPLFVNSGGGDYHLKAGSPAIDSGAAALYNSDYDGKAVPTGAGPDMGACEYGGTVPPGPTPTPPPGPTPTPAPPPSTGMLQNGSFESSLNPWTLKLYSPGNASLTSDSSTKVVGTSSARVANISGVDANNAYHIQLRQDNINLSGGKKYELAFWARSDANRTLEAIVQVMSSPYALDANQTVNLTTTWQRYTVMFTPGESQSTFIGFDLAANGSTVWIDGVQLRVVPQFVVRTRVYLPKLNR